jgi:hypothetical protein
VPLHGAGVVAEGVALLAVPARGVHVAPDVNGMALMQSSLTGACALTLLLSSKRANRATAHLRRILIKGIDVFIAWFRFHRIQDHYKKSLKVQA